MTESESNSLTRNYERDFKIVADYVRPLIPDWQNPEQADSPYGIIGRMVDFKERAEAAEHAIQHEINTRRDMVKMIEAISEALYRYGDKAAMSNAPPHLQWAIDVAMVKGKRA
jgi:hypothetical protein